jgi:hypothetical protein
VRITEEDPELQCVVEGCQRQAAEPPVVFSETNVLLCPEHREEFNADPLEWDGELEPDGQRVVRIWRREGIGAAS